MIKLADGVFTWSYFNTEKKYNFNGFLFDTPDAKIVVDPPTLTRDDEAYYETLGFNPDLFIITNRNHTRALDWFIKRKPAPVAMHEDEVGQVDIKVDRRLKDGEPLPGGFQVIHLPGKSPGEIGLYWRQRKLLMLGDALIAPFGRLGLIPDAKLDAPALLRTSLRKLLPLDFDALLLADGDPLLSGAKPKVDGLIASLS